MPPTTAAEWTMKVLIGYDGSEGADAAIDDLSRAGLPPRVEVLVVSAADVFPHLPPEVYEPAGPAETAAQELSPALRKARALAAQAWGEAKDLAARGAERARARHPAWDVEPAPRAGSPHCAIVAEADAWKPDLVVVGSQGRSAVGRALLGSVSQQVLYHAPCSVRIARRPEGVARPAQQPRLVIGIDGSPDAAAAISAVSMRPWPAGTRMQVVTAADLAATTGLAGLGPPEAALAAAMLPAELDEQAWARRAVENAADELRAAGLDVTPRVVAGDPKRVLLDIAEQWGADCIFVGAKGHSRIERFVLGSVSSAVAARARCTVEVVRQGA